MYAMILATTISAQCLGCPDIGDTHPCDGVVNEQDILRLFHNWGVVGLLCCGGDVTCDGLRNVDDLILMLENYG